MYSTIFLSFVLCVVAVLAVKDDVSCVVHSDDCGRCVSNGCNWCSDGYCVSEASDICEIHKVAASCSVKPVDHERHLGRRASEPCESITSGCGDCGAASCSLCEDEAANFKCSTDNTCTANAYNAPNEDWIGNAGLDSSTFSSIASCPQDLKEADDSPTLKVQVTFKSTRQDAITAYTKNRVFYKAKFVGVLRKYLNTKKLKAHSFIIKSASVAKRARRQSLDPDTFDATVLVKFADADDFTAQALASTLIVAWSDESDTPITLASDSVPIIAMPYTKGTGTTGVIVSTGNVVSRGGGSDVDLSRGALAGIIIGCLIGGALVVALIAFFIVHRRDAPHQAFRSPAAAYRP